MQITVLGAGLIGSAIVRDLALEPGWTVQAVDRDLQALEPLRAQAPIAVLQADLREEVGVAHTVRDADLVICAVPGFMGFETLKRVIEAGKNVVDISFFAQDAFLLDGLAQERGVTAVVDCGVAPGLCNILAGHVDSTLDQLDSYTCYVGGLPRERRWPYEYGVVFSPVDVIEEYTRPARFLEHGRQVVRPALSEVELRDFAGVGTLEAFNTDGLRTLMRTLGAQSMKEKTLRYPGHIEYIRVLRETGFFNKMPVEINGMTVRPIDLTAKLLFPKWKLKKDDREFTVMKVNIRGNDSGTLVDHTYHLFDQYNEATSTSSMARTTGYTCTAVARLILENKFTRKGICPPEYIGVTESCFKFIWNYLAKRNIRYSLEAHKD